MVSRIRASLDGGACTRYSIRRVSMTEISNQLKIKAEMAASTCIKCIGRGEYRHPHGNVMQPCEACLGSGWTDGIPRELKIVNVRDNAWNAWYERNTQ